MVDPDVVSLNGLKSPGDNGVRIVDEKLAVTQPPGTPPSDASPLPPEASRITLAGGAGAATGAAIVYAANHYVKDQDVKSTIVYFSPLLGIMSASIYDFCKTWCSRTLKRRQEENKRKEIICSMTEAERVTKELLASIDADQLSTIQQKTKVRSDLQVIQREIIKLHVKGYVILD